MSPSYGLLNPLKVALLISFLTIMSLGVYFGMDLDRLGSLPRIVLDFGKQTTVTVPNSGFEFEVVNSGALVGSPTDRFRDNLRNGTHYLTSWAGGGISNQFISYVNMLYLATRADRIPILPPFVPHHGISRQGGIFPFGDVFNLTHLSDVLGIPVLEFRDVKRLPSPEDSYNTTVIEQLGCWSSIPHSAGRKPMAAGNLMDHLGLDVSYALLPSDMYRQENDQDIHVVFTEVASLIYPDFPLRKPATFPVYTPSKLGYKMTPEDQLSCFDFLYYATTGRLAFEWEKPWAPVWRFVGKHIRFTDRMEETGKVYLRKLFKIDSEEEVPPFIAIHARRGDFEMARCGGQKKENCLPTVKALGEMVKDLQEELKEKRDGMDVREVMVTSNENDPAFWKEISDAGWKYINHTAEETVERYGVWYPVLLDVVVQGLSTGFIGTEASTFSLISKRRVEDWNGGIGKWAAAHKNSYKDE